MTNTADHKKREVDVYIGPNKSGLEKLVKPMEMVKSGKGLIFAEGATKVVIDGGETHEMQYRNIFGIGVRMMEGFIVNTGGFESDVFGFIADVIADEPERVYSIPGGQFVRALEIGGAVVLSEKAKDLELSIPQLAFCQAVVNVASQVK